ncbi:MAG: phytoene desaturase family protein [Fibrobacterota bacterium]
MTQNKKSAVIIGGGLGGLSTAVSLANRGYAVRLFEKNEHLGGKLNQKEMQGFTFDLGPSILTMPRIFRRLFQEAGKSMDDYCRIIPLQRHWRNIFESGPTFDFFSSPEKTAAHLEEHFPGAGKQFTAYMAYLRRQLRIIDAGYFEKGIDTFGGMFRGTPLKDLIFGLDNYHSMHSTNTSFFGNTPLRDAFDYFIKYVGSSALDAPGFMNILPAVQFEEGLWYVEGGMFNLSRALVRLAEDLGVELNTGTEVTRIIRRDGSARGVVCAGGEEVSADLVVSNMEVIPAMKRLLDAPQKNITRMEHRFGPACSGLVLHLGLDKIYDQLGHHSFIYSNDQTDHFNRVFRQGKLPDDPTLYVVAVTRTDPSQAPEGCDNIKILPHIPPIDPDNPFSPQEYDALAELCLDKMERAGLRDIRKHIIVRDQWTPVDIEANYYSNRGAIYGVESKHWRNFALKAPKKYPHLKNLWFTGGSVNPGGGMPMAVLSGYNAARQICGEMPLL